MRKMKFTLFLLFAFTLPTFAAELDVKLATTLNYNKVEYLGVKANTSSIHDITLVNNTDKAKRIKIWFRLCINGQCQEYKNNIIANPHYPFKLIKYLYFSPYLKNQTNYAVSAVTDVTDEHGTLYRDFKNGEIEVRN